MSDVNQGIDPGKEAVLIADDDPLDRDVIREFMSSLGFPVAVVSNGLEAFQVLEKGAYTFLITDMRMPGMDGMELIRESRRLFPNLGIISITGFAEGLRYIDVINAGASDFIKKPFELEELEAKVRRIIMERMLREELSRLSITDALTGLFNHRQFYLRIKEEIVRARRQRQHLTIVLIDLDNFKVYNDTRGHLAGDDLLRDVGSILMRCIRVGVDSAYRYGGDEFALILIDADLHVANDIVNRINSEFTEHGALEASYGVTHFEPWMNELDLVGCADRGLYAMKNRKKKSRQNAAETPGEPPEPPGHPLA